MDATEKPDPPRPFFESAPTARMLRQSPDLARPEHPQLRPATWTPSRARARVAESPGCCAGGSGLDLMIRQAFQIGMLQDAREIRAFCEWLQPRGLCHVLEIGTYRGGSFYLWCNLLASGLRISVDCPSEQNGRLSAAAIDGRNRLMGGWPGWVHIINGNSRAQAVWRQVTEILDGKPLDFVFIDGGHDYTTVWSDTMLYGNLVRSGGVVAWHDVSSGQRGSTGPREAWRRIKSMGSEVCEFIGDGPGIGALVRG